MRFPIAYCSFRYIKFKIMQKYILFLNIISTKYEIYYFKNTNNNWEFDGRWNTVWSKMGSANGFIWPYIR